MAAARAGDRDALDQLLRRHYTRIYAVCRRMTGNNADAADATQEALIAVVRGLPRFDGRSAFSTWAYRVAANASLDELRRRRRRPSLGESDRPLEVVDPASDTPYRAVDDTVAHGAPLEQAIASLPEDFRLAVVLRDVADFDYSEIAERLGVPLGTVKSRIARGRRMLADLLDTEIGNRQPADRRPTEAP